MFVLLLFLTCQGCGEDVFDKYTTNAIMKVVVVGRDHCHGRALSVAVSFASISAAYVDQ